MMHVCAIRMCDVCLICVCVGVCVCMGSDICSREMSKVVLGCANDVCRVCVCVICVLCPIFVLGTVCCNRMWCWCRAFVCANMNVDIV